VLFGKWTVVRPAKFAACSSSGLDLSRQQLCECSGLLRNVYDNCTCRGREGSLFVVRSSA